MRLTERAKDRLAWLFFGLSVVFILLIVLVVVYLVLVGQD
jgi:hypothetical protein